MFWDPYLDQLELFNSGKKSWQFVLMSEHLDTPLCSFMHLRLTWLAAFSKFLFNQAWSLKAVPPSWGTLQGFRCNPSALGKFSRWHGFFFWEAFTAWSIYAVPLHQVYGSTKTRRVLHSSWSFPWVLLMQKLHGPTALCLFDFFFAHKQPHTQAGTIAFALWSTLAHYSGRAVAARWSAVQLLPVDPWDYLHTLGVPPSSVPHCSAYHPSWFAGLAVCSVTLESPWLATLLSVWIWSVWPLVCGSRV